MPSVFVSHSAKTDADVALLKAVCAALRDARIQVLVDVETIEIGQPWRQEIHQWMAECDAGVLLLSKAALESSDWVLKEATCLTWRRTLDPDFALLPVLIGGATRADVEREQRFSPLFLAEIQHARSGEPAAVAAQIVGALRGRLGIARPPPLHDLVAKLQQQLGTMNEQSLVAVTLKIGLEGQPWQPGRLRHEELAERLARRVVQEGWDGLIAILDALSGFVSKETAEKILGLVHWFWVSPAAASRIPGSAEGRGRTLGLNGRRVPQFTAQAYICRAHWGSTLWSFVKVAGGSGPDREGDIVDQVRAELEHRGKGETSEDIDEYLATTRLPLFVLLPPPVPDPELAARLEVRWPRVTFIAHTGERLPSACAHIEMLEPALDLAVERAAHTAYHDAREMIRNFPEHAMRG